MVKTMVKTVYDTVGVFWDDSHDFTCVAFICFYLVEEDITSYFARIFSAVDRTGGDDIEPPVP